MNLQKILSKYEFSEIRIESGEEKAVRIAHDEVRTYSSSWNGISARVLENGSWGFASSNRKTSPEKLLETAARLARLKKGSVKIMSYSPEKTRLTEAAKLPESDEVPELLETNSIMKGKKVKSTRVSYRRTNVKREYFNSEGSEIQEDATYHSAFCSCISKKDDRIERGFGKTHSRKNFKELKLDEAAKEAKTKALKMLEAKPGPKGVYTVVLDNKLTGVFAHEALGHAAEADHVAAGESILKDKTGEKIGSGLVTIYDDPAADDFGRYSFDDEGIPARKTMLIEKGIVKNFMSSRESSAKLGIKLNGHCRAEGYWDVPVVRMSNTYFEKGGSSVEDLLDVRKGIYLKGVSGGSVDTFSGGFMFKAEEAYRIKNGELGSIMKDVSISGNILSALKNVEGVGKDFGTSPGFCGKLSQSVPVSDGGPHIRVGKMMIG